MNGTRGWFGEMDDKVGRITGIADGWKPLYAEIPIHWKLDDETVIAMTSWCLGDLRLLRGSAPPFFLERTSADVGRDRYDQLSISLLTSGSSVISSQGRTATYEVGDLMIIDEMSPYTIDAQATDFISIILPRRLVLAHRPDIRTQRVNATRAEALSGLSLAALLRTLIHHRPTGLRDEDSSVTQAVVSLVAGTIEAQSAPAPRRSPRNPIRDSVRSFVMNNLTYRDLSPEIIAAAIGVSRSSLYRAFASTGGVSQFIQICRLDAVRELLARPSEHRGIAELALTFGFASTAHFSRVFRARNGLSPRQFRAERSGDDLAEE